MTVKIKILISLSFQSPGPIQQCTALMSMSKLAVSCVQISGEQRYVSLAGTNHHRLWHELCHLPVTLSQQMDTEAHLWLHTDDGAGEKPSLKLNSGSLPYAQTH